jgi:hypothetical protein
MELDIFIKETLVSIGRGITSANEMLSHPPPFQLLGGESGTIDFEIQVVVEKNITKSLKGSMGTALALQSLLKVAVSSHLDAKNKDLNKHLIKFKVRPDQRSFFELSNAIKEEEK